LLCLIFTHFASIVLHHCVLVLVTCIWVLFQVCLYVHNIIFKYNNFIDELQHVEENVTISTISTISSITCVIGVIAIRGPGCGDCKLCDIEMISITSIGLGGFLMMSLQACSSVHSSNTEPEWKLKFCDQEVLLCHQTYNL
jgi:hypothetical protein